MASKLGKIRDAVSFARNRGNVKEHRQRMSDMSKAQDVAMKKQALKTVIMDKIRSELDENSENSILVEVDEEYADIFDEVLEDSDITQTFKIERDSDNPCRALFAWFIIEF